MENIHCDGNAVQLFSQVANFRPKLQNKSKLSLFVLCFSFLSHFSFIYLTNENGNAAIVLRRSTLRFFLDTWKVASFAFLPSNKPPLLDLFAMSSTEDFYLRYYVGHKGKFGHEFLEFEFRPDGKLRYANNSNYKNDTMIRKEAYVHSSVMDELKRVILDSEIMDEDDSLWPPPDRVGRQVNIFPNPVLLEVMCGWFVCILLLLSSRSWRLLSAMNTSPSRPRKLARWWTWTSQRIRMVCVCFTTSFRIWSVWSSHWLDCTLRLSPYKTIHTHSAGPSGFYLPPRYLKMKHFVIKEPYDCNQYFRSFYSYVFINT